MSKKGVLLIFVSFIYFTLFSQSFGELSLEQCIQLAEQHSYILKANESDIAAAGNMASLAKTMTIPKINAELSTDNRFLKPYTYNQTWASVYADWSLGDFIKKTDRSAIQDIETQKILKEQSVLDLSGRIASLYMSILQIQKQAEIIDVRLKFLQKHLDVSEGLWHAGIRTQLDILQTETEIIAEQEIISNLSSEKTILENELIPLLGMNTSDSFQLKPIEIDSILLIPVPEINSESISQNPLLFLYNSKIKLNEYQAEEVLAKQLPHVKLGSSYTIDGDPTSDGNYLGINAGVYVPIYYGKEIKYQQQAIENSILSLQMQKQEAEQDLSIKLIQARERLIQLKNLLQIQYKKIEVAKTTMNYAEMNYKAGISTNLEFLTAQQTLINSEFAIEETLLNYTMGLIDFYMISAQTQNIVSLGNIQ
jgi:outer membrane protein TolC